MVVKEGVMMESIQSALNKILRGASTQAEYQKTMQKVFNDPDVRAFLDAHADKLSEQMIVRGSSKLYEFYHDRELIKAGQKTIAPGYAPQLRVGSTGIEVTYAPTKQLEKQREQRELEQRVRSLHMPKFIRHASFDDFYVKDQPDDRTAALAAAVNFVKTYQPGHFQKGLYLYGKFGVGKTYLLGALANALAKRKVKSTILHMPSFAVEMRNSIRANSTGEKISTVEASPILMIDDIGADTMSSWVRDDVLGVILEYRMQEELPTFFSSNFSMDELEHDHLAINVNGDEEPVKAERLMERIKFLSSEMQMSGNNYRQRPKNPVK